MNKVIINGVEYAPIGKPRPLLADAKVGDLCRLRNGGYTQIESVKRRSGKTWYYRTDGYTSYPDGRLFKGENNEPDIIHTEPLAEVGTAEWAWQMAKLGIETRCCEGKIRVSKSGLIEVCYNGMAYAMPLTQSPDNKAYTIKKISQCSPTGWQLYEPKPQPQYKVGDWVEYKKDKHYQVDSVHDSCCYLSYGKGCGCFSALYSDITRKLSPSEVVIHIGCLSGKVEKAYGEKKGTFILRGLSGQRNVLWLSMLDARTRELVESLLKAQEEK